MEKDLFKSKTDQESLKRDSRNYLSWVLSDRQICDLELLINGGFNPLDGFMNKGDYESVLNNMRLENGKLFPIPINLDVTKSFSKKIKIKDNITLRDKEGFPLAVMTIQDIWEPDLQKEANLVYGTKNQNHPAVNYLVNISNQVYVGGKLESISLPRHYDYQKYRHTPQNLKSEFKRLAGVFGAGMFGGSAASQNPLSQIPGVSTGIDQLSSILSPETQPEAPARSSAPAGSGGAYGSLEDDIFFLAPAADAFVKLTPDLQKQIDDGDIRL